MMESRATLLAAGSEILKVTSQSPRLDAEILLCFALDIDRVQLISRPETMVSTKEAGLYRALIARRSLHEPVAYLTGVKEFYGLEFKVTPAVLIPRPETELLVEEVLAIAEKVKGPFRLLDLGTGSGCIPIAVSAVLARNGRRAHALGIDLSLAALMVADENRRLHGVEECVQFACSNWFDALNAREAWNCVVANPPYIPKESKLAPDLNFEPHQALYAGDDGLSAYREIFPAVAARIGADGIFITEIGHGQGSPLIDLWRQHSGRPVEVRKDLAGLERILITPYK